MPVDSQVRQILDQGSLLPPMETLSFDAARQRCLDVFCAKKKQSVKKVLNQTINNIPVRIYTPVMDKDLPILVYFHGGGFVVNDLSTHDAICRHLANNSESIVISVDYARAPEFKYPVALQQCYEITVWAALYARNIGGDPARIAVGGDSSGGMLAAGVTLMARDRLNLDLCFQLLLYPALDYYLPGTSSYKNFSTGYSLTRETMKWFFNQYLPKEFDRNDPYLFPLKAKNFDNLPDALIITAKYDPLRDEAELYAGLLVKAGGSVILNTYKGMIHGFIIMHENIDKGKAALESIGSIMKKKFLSLKK